MKKAFTLIELIFVIIIIGILAVVAIPRFAGLTDSARISAELSTIASAQSVISQVHSEWVTSRCPFQWGPNNLASATTLSDEGYPTLLGAHLENILRNVDADVWQCTNGGANGSICVGPASNGAENGVTDCRDNRPCVGRSWQYNSATGQLTLQQ